MTTEDLVRQERSQFIKSKAAEIGFDFCGISKAEFLEAEAPQTGKLAKPSATRRDGIYGQSF